MLLAAARGYLADDSVPPTTFVIAGDGHLREPLESKASELGISDRVRFIGNREDADVVYAGLDAVALTSLNEGTPLSLIEAMASGLPVISTAVGGVVDLLGKKQRDVDGFTIRERGLSAASQDAAGFAKGLIYLAKNERLRIGLAADGRRFVHSLYSKERLVDDIRSLYRRLELGRHGHLPFCVHRAASLWIFFSKIRWLPAAFASFCPRCLRWA